MKATIRDVATLSTVKPLELVSYLRTREWDPAGEKPGEWSRWTRKEGNEEVEIVVPMTTEISDFSYRMSDALAVLEAVEQRSQLEIYRDLIVTSADMVRVRLIDSEFSDGSIPLEDGARFFQSAKEMMVFAACSAHEKRSYFPSRRPDQVNDYLRKTRLGQTEQGSFVMTIISKVPPLLSTGNGQLFENDEPFERKVTSTLAFALAAIRSASDKAASTGMVKAFVSGVSVGVSANLCDALVGLATASDANTHALEIQFSWSRNRPNQQASPTEIFFPTDTFPVIAAASRHLKESSPIPDFVAHGPVIKLHREANQPTGKVTIHCFVENLPRKVTVELQDQNYLLAAHAHADGYLVQCLGTLVRDGRNFRLENPSNFKVEQG